MTLLGLLGTPKGGPPIHALVNALPKSRSKVFAEISAPPPNHFQLHWDRPAETSFGKSLAHRPPHWLTRKPLRYPETSQPVEFCGRRTQMEKRCRRMPLEMFANFGNAAGYSPTS
jgi:hypothetical protein